MKRRTFFLLVCGLLAALCGAPGLTKGVTDSSDIIKLSASDVLEARHVRADFAVNDFDNAAWRRASMMLIRHYWSGEPAPAARHALARLVWSDKALYARFDARRGEPLVVSDKPKLDEKTLGLWERDVCELFVAPDAAAPERYYEFEVAPTGEWVDLGIHWRPEGRETDWQYHSGATFAARTEKDTITLTMRIPFAALGASPHAGARWRANLFRCVGAGATRGYLAWQPTLTAEPSFHVPQHFGWLHFKD